MSEPTSVPHVATPSLSTPPPKTSGLGAVFEVLQLVISLALVACVLAWLVWTPEDTKASQPNTVSAPKRMAAEVSGFKQLSVELDSPLGRRLALRPLMPIQVTEPLMHVTGRVAASRRPGAEGGKDFWQFTSGDLLNTYASWEKATVDVLFFTSQLEQIKALAVAKETALQKLTEQMTNLVKGGSEAQRDLAKLQAELLQTQIQDRKDVYEAELAIKTAQREANTLALQLFQSGFDPEKLHEATTDLDIVTAEVPEALLDRVIIGQSCTAQFYGIPDETFEGKVATLSPVLSTEQRTLRVLFTLDDPQDRLRPGMFASIGLGTDPRAVLRIPAESVVHVGRTDYVLVVDGQPEPAAPPAQDAPQPPVVSVPQAEPLTGDQTGRVLVRVTPVVVSELIEGLVEVKSGVTAGDQIVSDHGILLKPLVVTSLRAPNVAPEKPATPAAPEQPAAGKVQ